MRSGRPDCRRTTCCSQTFSNRVVGRVLMLGCSMLACSCSLRRWPGRSGAVGDRALGRGRYQARVLAHDAGGGSRWRTARTGARRSPAARISSSLRSTERVRAATSKVTVSPSRTAAMGPPSTASGATWPAISPWVAPEKRPSVSSPTEGPSPAPVRAAVTASISRMPGPPRGPSPRITTTSPAEMAPRCTASNASSSQSNTRAGPL